MKGLRDEFRNSSRWSYVGQDGELIHMLDRIDDCFRTMFANDLMGNQPSN